MIRRARPGGRAQTRASAPPWLSLGLSLGVGSAWLSLGLSLAQFDSDWLSLTQIGPAWLTLGSVWASLAQLGPVWASCVLPRIGRNGRLGLYKLNPQPTGVCAG